MSRFHVLSQTESTNKYAMALLHEGPADHGDAVFAFEQTAGRGRRSKQWKSEPGQNILLSVILKPPFALNPSLFGLHLRASLGCMDLWRPIVNDYIKIKWPNDIYIYDRKAGGILIENLFRGAKWQGSVIGIGLNVNQTRFDLTENNPISLKMVTGKSFEVLEMAKNLSHLVTARFEEPEANEEQMFFEYNRVLYARGEKACLRANGEVFEARVLGVDRAGKLITDRPGECRFAFEEVKFLGLVHENP